MLLPSYDLKGERMERSTAWYLASPESLPPIDPRLLVLEPQKKNRTRARPKGAKNKPTSQEEATSTQDTAMATET
jgi:hypothetical protein